MYNKLAIINYQGYNVRDISKMLDVIPEAKSNAVAFDTYIVEDGETPETIAQDFYNDPYLNWLVLIVNDIVDPFYDWPLNQTELMSLVTRKYGAGNEQSVHHYELNNIVVPSTTTNAFPVSNYMHEENINEEKRKIKILKEEWLEQVKIDLNKAVL